MKSRGSWAPNMYVRWLYLDLFQREGADWEDELDLK